jgi:uncharacterized cupredoxin-like copper-binding protein
MLLLVLLLCGIVPEAIAAGGSLLAQPATEVQVSLGNAAGALQFFPNTLEFKVGDRYKLLLENPSSLKHYFTAKDFTDAIWTQKIEAQGVEVKGIVREVELKPGSAAEWVFVPIKPGHYDLRCTIAGHAGAGMTGDITISY